MEAIVVNALLDVAAGQREAAGLVVGGDHHKGVAVLLGPIEHRMEHQFKVGQLGTQVGRVVVVAGPINLRAFYQHS